MPSDSGSGGRRRRRSYRRLLLRRILTRYAACLLAIGAAVAVTPLLLLVVYPVCGFYLSRYIASRAIWIAIEPAHKIADAKGRMVMLWPVQALRYVRELRVRPGGVGDAAAAKAPEPPAAEPPPAAAEPRRDRAA